MLLLLDACSMQLVPASAAAVARDFCCCCLLFDVWVALFFVVIVVCAVLIASISAILGVLQALAGATGGDWVQFHSTHCH